MQSSCSILKLIQKQSNNKILNLSRTKQLIIFFGDAETTAEVKQDEVIQPDKTNKTTNKDKAKVVDIKETELTQEELEIFGDGNFFGGE